MILVRITMHVLPEKRKEISQTLVSMIEPTCREEGCLSYRVYQDIEDQNVFNLIEEWRTRQDLDNYIRSDRFGVLLGTRSLLAEPSEIKFHTVSHSEGAEAVKAARGKGTLKR
jgi:quinol monooxygenase YgiN